MAERTTEQIAAMQLNYDVAEAKNDLDRKLHGTASGKSVVDAIENLIGKTVVRWWFARACRNRLAAETVDQKAIEERRTVRAQKFIAMTSIINAKTNEGKAPTTLDLQLGMLDLIANMNGIWQALFDAGIIHPNAKQDYLDAGCDELYQRIVGYAGKIDLGKAPSARSSH